jgi:hypothetical protein
MLGAIDEILFRRVVEVFELVLTAELAGQWGFFWGTQGEVPG